MASIRILCPNCHKCLGDTDTSIDANINCHYCKRTCHVKMVVANYKDYIDTYADGKADSKHESAQYNSSKARH